MYSFNLERRGEGRERRKKREGLGEEENRERRRKSIDWERIVKEEGREGEDRRRKIRREEYSIRYNI